MSTEDKALVQRTKVFGWMIWLILFVLLARLWQLQIIQGDRYSALAEGNKSRMERVSPARGDILDRNGTKLATNKAVYQVTVIKDHLDQPITEVASTLATITGANADEIVQRLQSKEYRSFEPVPVVLNLSPEAIIRLAEKQQDLPGVNLESVVSRTYPQGQTASHLVGYLGMINSDELSTLSGYYGTDLIGKSGLERAYERDLKGENGWILREVDAVGRPQRVIESQDPVPGNNIILSIDSRLQRVAEETIDAQLAELQGKANGPDAKAGVIVAMDPWTGEILAIASRPGFDPNLLLPNVPERNFAQLQRDPSLPMLNRATQGMYPPGSAFKPVTAVAALDLGKLNPDELYYATGKSKYGKKDWILNQYPPLPPHGWIDLATALERSSNDFFWEMSFRLGVESIAKYSRMFGFGSSTGIDLYPGDKAGLVPDPDWKKEVFAKKPIWERNWYEAETMDFSIGQGYLLVTPLQVAQMYSTLATKGTQYAPRLVRAVMDPTGGIVNELEPIVARKISMAAAHWSAIEKGLVAVVKNRRGTAHNVFRGFDTPVAGKTGTAQVTGADGHGWFAGYAPVDKPEVVVVAFVEHGGGGASAAAPMARKFLEAYFSPPQEAGQDEQEDPVDQ